MSSFAWGVLLIFAVGAIGAVAAALASRGLHDRIGKGDFTLDTPDHEPSRAPAPGSPAARAEAELEIRQLVEAKSARRQARGEGPLDVEAEVAALTRPPAVARDEALRDEVRQLVVARNERRATRGEPPLDVEAEVDRQLRDLG